jgi:hypothetical protein
MSALLTDKTMAKLPWAGLHTGQPGLLDIMQKTLSALLARYLRRVEAELRSFDRHMWPRSQQDRIPLKDDASERTWREAVWLKKINDS